MGNAYGNVPKTSQSSGARRAPEKLSQFNLQLHARVDKISAVASLAGSSWRLVPIQCLQGEEPALLEADKHAHSQLDGTLEKSECCFAVASLSR
jgi:hypothetical protein